jgi:AcrR family transcriptional regulator
LRDIMPRTAPEKPDLLARCAFEVFAEQGFNNATVDDITLKAGVTKGSFYSHYRSKREIILAACNYYYQKYQQLIHAETVGTADPLERLRAVLKRSVYTCVVDHHSRSFTTEIFALSLQDEAVRASWAQFYDTVRQMYLGLTRAAIAAGQLNLEYPEAAVNLLLAALEGVKVRATFEPRVATPAEQDAIVEGLMEILKPITHPQETQSS